MQLQCPVLLEGNTIPEKYTCDGENISPPLRWQNAPNGTRTYALIVEDPDAPGKVFTHWVLYDMPVERQQLSEAIASQPQDKAMMKQGKNDFGNLGYGGPCPPAGAHRYVFRLYALDQMLELQPGAAKVDLLNLMQGHILETAEVTGIYERKGS